MNAELETRFPVHNVPATRKIIVELSVRRETDRAILVEAPDVISRQVWLPKSQARVVSTLANGAQSVHMPNWLYEKLREQL